MGRSRGSNDTRCHHHLRATTTTTAAGGGGGTPGGEEDVGVGEEAEIDARECEEDGDRIGEVRERRARELYRDTWHESPGLAKIKGMRIIFSFFCFVDPTGRDSSAVLTPSNDCLIFE